MAKGKLKTIINFLTNRELEEDVLEAVDKATKKSSTIMKNNVQKKGRELFYKARKGEKRKYKRTGNLVRSVRANTSLGAGKAEIQINPVRGGADVNYGVYVEYGTRYMSPRPFIRQGVAESDRQIQEMFKSELGSLRQRKLR